jgi:hypothetical protein
MQSSIVLLHQISDDVMAVSPQAMSKQVEYLADVRLKEIE